MTSVYTSEANEPSGLMPSSILYEPMFEVMITMVLRKSTVRPWLSVSLPSSRSCSRVLNTSGCAFSISSNRMTL